MKGAIGNIASTTSLGAYRYNASVGGCVAGTLATKPQAVSSAGSYSYLYDCNGNVTNRTVSGSGYTLSYDLENWLTGVSGGAGATFVYEGDGNRVKGTVASVTDHVMALLHAGHLQFCGAYPLYFILQPLQLEPADVRPRSYRPFPEPPRRSSQPGIGP